MADTQESLTRLKIENPPLDKNPRTYMTADANASATDIDINVLSTTGFVTSGTVDYYILIGDYGQERTELKLTDASDATVSSFELATLTYSHEASTPVTLALYNQIKVYGLAKSGDIPVVDSPIDTIDIDVTQQFTKYDYTGTTYSIFVFAYYNSTTLKISTYSDEITSTVYDRRSARKVIESGLRKAMTNIDESKNSKLNWETAIGILNDGLDEIMARKRKWLFLHTVSSGTSTTASQAYIEKPSGIAILEHLIVDNYNLTWMPRLQYDGYTKSGVTVSTGDPSHYTLKNNKYYLYPTPSAALDVIFEYYRYPTEVTSLTDAIDIVFTPLLIYYCAAHFSYIRGNDARGDKMFALFNRVLEQQCEEFSGPEQLGTGEVVESVSGIWADDIDY